VACGGSTSSKEHATHDAATMKTPSEPYVLVLGTAQDGGLPQIGCDEQICRRARAHPEFRRLVTSLLLCDPRSGRRWLFDAGPDLREQVERAHGHPPSRVASGARPPLFEGVFLTHAHIGHYTGLMFLGREAYAAHELPVYATARMGELLRSAGPWSQLVELGHIELVAIESERAIELASDLTVTPLEVPHRGELSDTVAFLIRGPTRKLVYLPDIDKWERWDRPIEKLLAEVDVALLDGTFFADGEIPGRSMRDIPHPFIVESFARFAPLPAAERRKVFFTHLNHTNPASDPESAAAARVREAGMDVARELQVLTL
ncbi:MAG TPA: MBL fold metallo-hydrolase, partial [Polyangiaceae bacterium]|nr:MBL fold metallo-hydrolase [Polyangiaceae bacterium]